MAKRLSEEEKLFREWKKDEEIKYVVQCTKCKQPHTIVFPVIQYTCKCGNSFIVNRKIDTKKCTIKYSREDN